MGSESDIAGSVGVAESPCPVLLVAASVWADALSSDRYSAEDREDVFVFLEAVLGGAKTMTDAAGRVNWHLTRAASTLDRFLRGPVVGLLVRGKIPDAEKVLLAEAVERCRPRRTG